MSLIVGPVPASRARIQPWYGPGNCLGTDPDSPDRRIAPKAMKPNY